MSDIILVEQCRIASMKALRELYNAIPNDAPSYLLEYKSAANAGLIGLTCGPCNATYIAALQQAQIVRDSLLGPQDAFTSDLHWQSEEMRSKRFIIKACGLWSDEYQEPLVTDPRTWSQINLAADLIGKYLTNPKYGSALTPDLFRKYFASTTDSPLRPQYIPERFNEFLSWCRTKGFIS